MALGSAMEERISKRALRRHSVRRATTGFNVCIQLLLAAVAMVMVNYLASRYYHRWDISVRKPFQLSEKTLSLLSGVNDRVRMVVFIPRGHDVYDELRSLLAEYRYAARSMPGLDLDIEWVDPNRDLVRTRELVGQYDAKGANVLVVECAGRKAYVEDTDLVAYEIDYDELLSRGQTDRRRTGFTGEQAVSSAILRVVGGTAPVVCFLGGHGERDVGDFDEQTGYSRVARILRRDNIEVKPLVLAESEGVPGDCAAVVIAGPRRPVLAREAKALGAYLEKNGRLLAMLDPGGATGLEALLEKWGVRVCSDVAVGDRERALPGRELIVMEYTEHPVTRGMENVMSIFYMPRCIEPLEPGSTGAGVAADRPRVTPLVATSDGGWANADTSERPPVFTPGVDRRGPVSLAVAVEKGAVPGIDVEIRPTRLVVIGDSFFVANGAIGGAVGGNADLFMNAVNWLLEREDLLGVAPRMPWQAPLDMSRQQMKLAFLVIAAALPVVAVVAGVVVRWIRTS